MHQVRVRIVERVLCTVAIIATGSLSCSDAVDTGDLQPSAWFGSGVEATAPPGTPIGGGGDVVGAWPQPSLANCVVTMIPAESDRTRVFSYDERGRLVSLAFTAPQTHTTFAFRWEEGRLASARTTEGSENDASMEFRYRDDLVASVTSEVPEIDIYDRHELEYDSLSRPVRWTCRECGSVSQTTFEYGQTGYVQVREVDNLIDGVVDRSSQISFDDHGRIERSVTELPSLGSTLIAVYQYDALDRVTSIVRRVDGNPFDSLTYSYACP